MNVQLCYSLEFHIYQVWSILKTLQNYSTYLNKRGLSVDVSLFNLTCSRVNTNPVAVNTDPIKAPPAIKRADLLIARNK